MARPTRRKDGKFLVRYTDENGVQRHGGVYSTLPEAKAQQKMFEGRVEEIRRGIRDGRPLDKTCSDLFDYYLEKLTPQKRRPKDDAHLIEKHLRPFFGSIKLTELEGSIEDYKLAKKHMSANSINKQLTLLGTMCRVAQRQPLRWIKTLPEIRKPKIRLFEQDFRYLRNDEEIARFLIAARDEGLKPYTLYATANYTGMREGELAAIQWSDVDFNRLLIALQRSHDGSTKSRNVRYVPILDPLLPILREWRLQSHGTGLMFPSDWGTMLSGSSRIFQETFYRVLDRAGFPKVERRGKLLRYITFHDLRHTFASHWMMNGGDIFKLSKILGHKTIQMTMRYAHLAPTAFQDDLDRLGQVAPGFISGQIIPLPSQAR